MFGHTPRQPLLERSGCRLLCCPRPSHSNGGRDMSKKGTSGKRLPSHSNGIPEEIRKFLKSLVYRMIEAGDIAPDPCDPSPCSYALGSPYRGA